MKQFRLILALLLLAPAAAMAHELQLGYLEIRQTSPDQYAVLWKLPARPNLREIHPTLPPDCKIIAGPIREQVGDSMIEQSDIRCPGGLDGKTISIDPNWAALLDVLVRVVQPDASTQVYRLTPLTTEFQIKPAPTWLDRSWTYLGQGIDHILMGVDHLLFVLGLLLLVDTRSMLFKTITSFTIAHSITLAVATFGVASVPTIPLNAAIALSILFLAPEVIRKERGQTSFTIRHPWVVAFAFGLLHGFGFASGLLNLGLSSGEIPLALLMFNVGVEIGQLFFVFVIIGLIHAFRTLEVRWPRWALSIPVYAVGGLGAFWTIQRTLIIMDPLFKSLLEKVKS